MTYELPYDFNLGINPCYTLYLRFNDCLATEPLKKIMCHDKLEDYHECKNHEKEIQYRAWYAKEYKKLKIISLPKYDDKTDSFTEASSNSVDAFFSNTDKMKSFFDLHKNFVPEKHSHGHH